MHLKLDNKYVLHMECFEVDTTDPVVHARYVLHNYLMPTVGDMPEIEVILIEDPEPLGPYGAKGIGEHALIPTAPAILGAIKHATGVSIHHVPATPDCVLATLQKAGKNG